MLYLSLFRTTYYPALGNFFLGSRGTVGSKIRKEMSLD